MKRLLIVVLVALGLFAASSVRILEERYVAFRTLLGDPSPRWFPWMDSQLVGPRIYVHVPLLHQVEVFDQRVQRFESEPRELYLEQDNVAIGYYVIWRIESVRRLLENTQPREILQLIDDKTYNAVRNELATRSLGDLLSDAREQISERIQAKSDEELDKIGIAVLGVRIRQVEFLATTLERVFDRMKQDRQRLARKLRAEGEEQAREIRANADRDAEVELAGARGEAARLRGEGDAQAAAIYSESFARDPEFYRFVRSLEAYRKSIDAQTTVVLSPDDPFLRYLFQEPEPAPTERAAEPPASSSTPAARAPDRSTSPPSFEAEATPATATP